MWFCSECGKKNSGKFCTYCGTEYVEVDEEFLASVPLDTTLSSEEPDDIFVRSEEEDEVCCASALFRKRDAEEKEIPFVTEEPTILDVDDDSISAKVEESSETVEEEIAPVEPENKSWFVSAGAMEKIELPDIEEEVSVMERKAPPVSPYWGEKDGHRAESWKSPFLRESHLSAEENGSAEFLRKEKTLVNADDISSPEEAAAENSGILGVFTHRFVPESEDEKVMRFGQRAIIAVGAVVGVICLAAIIMIGSL
ncbi:MAG: zinc ribbon domain-containing protein, partial [Firmicutes bacterium]|nr:zinc ribbon domain-containing protein [Bacillota bacterium]